MDETSGSVSGDCETACQVPAPPVVCWKYGSRESGLEEFFIIEIEVESGPLRGQKRRWASGESRTGKIALERFVGMVGGHLCLIWLARM